jgi:hypothetical protein
MGANPFKGDTSHALSFCALPLWRSENTEIRVPLV